MTIILNKLIDISRNCLKYNKTNAHIYVCTQKYSQTTNRNEAKAPPKEVNQSAKDGQKSLHVAVIGVPNAGKSTFINNLINHRVCPTSSKVHTTRRANKAICTTRNTQLVLYDTPGLVTQRDINKHHLEQSFKSAYRHAVQHADAIAVIHDVSNAWTRNELHSTVVETLKAYPTLPSFLVLNKIDALRSKRLLLDAIRILTNDTLSHKLHSKRADKTKTEASKEATVNEETTENSNKQKRETYWRNFEDVFLVSAITADGLNDVHDYLLKIAKPRVWQYAGDSFTDDTPENLIVESVRARLLDYLPQEIPYKLKTQMEFYSDENNTIYASVQVSCPTARIERLICGESNGKLRQITERVTSDLVETFGKPISLTISTIALKKDKKEATN